MTYEDAGEARKVTTSAISATRPSRPSGIRAARSANQSALCARRIGVSTMPGATALTRMPSRLSS